MQSFAEQAGMSNLSFYYCIIYLGVCGYITQGWGQRGLMIAGFIKYQI